MIAACWCFLESPGTTNLEACEPLMQAVIDAFCGRWPCFMQSVLLLQFTLTVDLLAGRRLHPNPGFICFLSKNGNLYKILVCVDGSLCRWVREQLLSLVLGVVIL